MPHSSSWRNYSPAGACQSPVLQKYCSIIVSKASLTCSIAPRLQCACTVKVLVQLQVGACTRTRTRTCTCNARVDSYKYVTFSRRVVDGCVIRIAGGSNKLIAKLSLSLSLSLSNGCCNPVCSHRIEDACSWANGETLGKSSCHSCRLENLNETI